MKKSLLILTLFCMCCLPAVGCKSRNLLVQTAPISIEGLDKTKVENAIKAAIPRRGWIMEKNEGQVIRARNLIRGKHTVVIDVDYSGDAIKIEYVESQNLDYQKEGDVEYIHKNYNVWTDYLRQDIAVEIGRLRV
jgi:hypothetical protein